MEIFIDGQKYNIPKQPKFIDIKRAIFTEFDLLISKFVADEVVVSDQMELSNYDGKRITGINDGYYYENYKDNYFRCVNCRRGLCINTLKCNHIGKCKLKFYKNKMLFTNISDLSFSGQSELSSIDKTNSNFTDANNCSNKSLSNLSSINKNAPKLSESDFQNNDTIKNEIKPESNSLSGVSIIFKNSSDFADESLSFLKQNEQKAEEVNKDEKEINAFIDINVSKVITY
jgi:hypothetical protein